MLAQLRAHEEREMEQREGMEKFMLSQLRQQELKVKKTTDRKEAHLRRVRDKLQERSRSVKRGKKCKAPIAPWPFTPSRMPHDDLPAYSFGRNDYNHFHFCGYYFCYKEDTFPCLLLWTVL